MTRLKQAFWRLVIWIAFRMLEAAGAKPRTPRKVYDFFLPMALKDEKRLFLFADIRRFVLSEGRWS